MATTKIGTNYLHTGKGPFDVKQVVTSYSKLLDPQTFGGYHYNGMIVGVSYGQSSDANKVGLYYLYDSTATSGFSPVDNTKEENWHRLATIGELTTVDDRVTVLEGNLANIDLEGLHSSIENITKQLATYDSAIQALQEANQETYNALAALVAEDTNKSIRQITKDEIASQMLDGDTDLGGLVLRIGSAEDAIKALQQGGLGGGVSEETVDAMISNAVGNLNASHIIGNDDTYDIGYNISNPKELIIRSVNISKLHQDVELILHGGSASIGTFN